MVTIVFESHATTTDNQNHLSSGHFDVELSELGLGQAKELGSRYENDHFDAIFCDARLRECDYGDLTQHPSAEVDPEKPRRVQQPFPGGESYEDTAKRMEAFLQDLLRDHDSQRVMIIGHRATQYGLEHWIKDVPLTDAVTAPWKWQPGWTYELKGMK
jgi:broad specificity phosphatase PhoE